MWFMFDHFCSFWEPSRPPYFNSDDNYQTRAQSKSQGFVWILRFFPLFLFSFVYFFWGGCWLLEWYAIEALSTMVGLLWKIHGGGKWGNCITDVRKEENFPVSPTLHASSWQAIPMMAGPCVVDVWLYLRHINNFEFGVINFVTCGLCYLE